MRSLSILAGASSMMAALAARSAMLERRIFGAENIERHLRRQKASYARGVDTSIATMSRHGGPHMHARESARRIRQMANGRG
jgi:hypothetical protein